MEQEVEVQAPDLGTALTIATKRMMAQGHTHVSIMGTRQTGSRTWVITLFVSDSQGVTARR
jgi:hypothetical protein